MYSVKEKRLENTAKAAMREQFPNIIIRKIGDHGWPDIMYITIKGKIGFIEFKSKSGELRMNQKAVIATLTQRGVHVDVCKTVSAAVASVSDTIRSS